MTVDIFFAFLCLFTFGKNEYIVRVLLSVCGIHSNRTLTYDQAITFCKCINENAFLDAKLFKWLADRQQSGITVDDMSRIVFEHDILITPFNNLQDALIMNFIGKTNFQRIVQRINYYDTVLNITPDNPILFISQPKEACCNKLIREVITREPPPYYTDYRVNHTDSKKSLKIVMSQLRTRYGYSRRLQASCARMSKASSRSTRPSIQLSENLTHCDDYDDGIQKINKTLEQQYHGSVHSILNKQDYINSSNCLRSSSHMLNASLSRRKVLKTRSSVRSSTVLPESASNKGST